MVVGVQVLLLNLEAHSVRVLVAPLDVIDRHSEAPAPGMPRCHSLEVNVAMLHLRGT